MNSKGRVEKKRRCDPLNLKPHAAKTKNDIILNLLDQYKVIFLWAYS